jgi:hypothetical protein
MYVYVYIHHGAGICFLLFFVMYIHIYHDAGTFEVELQRRRMPDITYIPDQVSGTIIHKTLKMRRHSIDNTLATHYQHVSNTLATL